MNAVNCFFKTGIGVTVKAEGIGSVRMLKVFDIVKIERLCLTLLIYRVERKRKVEVNRGPAKFLEKKRKKDVRSWEGESLQIERGL